MKAKSLIIEDESHCFDRLNTLIQKNHHEEIELLNWSRTIDEGIDAIYKYQPDLVFLDVELGDSNAFNLLKNLNISNFDIIFTTAHQEYAIQAIKLSALDYLLKPIGKEELGIAVQKHFQRLSNIQLIEKLDVLYEHLSTTPSQNKRISIPTISGFEFIKIQEIIRCQSDVNYTHIYLESNEKLTVARTLKDFESMLMPYGFFRVHNSHLINVSKVIRYQKGKGGFLTLENGIEIEVSHRRKDDLMQFMKKF